MVPLPSSFAINGGGVKTVGVGECRTCLLVPCVCWQYTGSAGRSLRSDVSQWPWWGCWSSWGRTGRSSPEWIPQPDQYRPEWSPRRSVDSRHGWISGRWRPHIFFSICRRGGKKKDKSATLAAALHSNRDVTMHHGMVKNWYKHVTIQIAWGEKWITTPFLNSRGHNLLWISHVRSSEQSFILVS